MADIADISNLNTYRGRQGSFGSLWYTWNIIHTGGNNSELAYSRVELDYSEKLRIGSLIKHVPIVGNLFEFKVAWAAAAAAAAARLRRKRLLSLRR